MAELTEITSGPRTTHVAWSGMNNQRTFNFKPYRAAPEVLEGLLGKVERPDGPKSDWVRTLPARDPVIKNCYCNEAHIEFPDPLAISSSPDIEKAAELAVRPAVPDLIDKLQIQPEDPLTGGIVTATYRPLITALIKEDENEPDLPEAFDWLDPTFNVSLREIPWPDGLWAACKSTFFFLVPMQAQVRIDGLDAEIQPLRVPVMDFTIRRILVGEIPWAAIQACGGCVNIDPWPDTSVYKLPRFEPGTLRFEGVTPFNRFDSTGRIWFELLLHFSWINYIGAPVFDIHGDPAPAGSPVTWNHVLCKPAQTFWGIGRRWEVGWFFIHRDHDIIAPLDIKLPHIFKRSDGPLYPFVEFDQLFALNPAI